MMLPIDIGTIIEEDELFANIQDYVSTLLQVDAILVLGGGVPSSPKDPPTYVKRRSDVVAKVINALQEQTNDTTSAPSVLCLSAGTAHLPQYILPHNGLPLWESTASAAYLMQLGVPEKNIFVETTSYDTISNAFFTRSSFTDINGWRRLLVVTNEFHIHRTKAIFDWIFSVPITEGGDPTTSYELFYLSCNNVGLSNEAVEARRSHEKRGERNVVENLSKQYTTLNGVLTFLTTKHDFYAANKLVRQSMGDGAEKRSGDLLKLSYGQKSSDGFSSESRIVQFQDGNIVVSLYSLVFVCLVVMGLYFSRRSYYRHNKES